MSTYPHPYPAGLEVRTPERLARWRPLVHWLLVIPHLVILYALGVLSQVVALVSWFAILFTGRLPAGLAGLQSMYLRYWERVMAYQGFLLETYPPFSFQTAGPDPRTYDPVVVDLAPALEHRSRLSTFFRLLLVIPQLIVLWFVGLAASIVWLVGFFAVLITGHWPQGMQRFVVGYMRWSLRVQAYALLLTDEYPPFSLD